MKRIILPTIDCDPGLTTLARIQRTRAFSTEERERRLRLYRDEQTSREDYRMAVTCLFDIFDQSNLRGKVTWFLNERDVGWTRYFPDLVREIVSRNDVVALHTHFGAFWLDNPLETEEEVFEDCLSSKKSLEEVSGKEIFFFRSGCFFQAEYIYKALYRLGIRVVSNVNPGLVLDADTEGRPIDHSTVPVSAQPWRHGVDNWLDCTSETGHFLHIPVAAEGLGEISQLVNKATSDNVPVVCYVLHPHEIQSERGGLDEDKVRSLVRSVDMMNRDLSPCHVNFAEAESLLGR